MKARFLGAMALVVGGASLFIAPASATPINVSGGGVFNFSNLSINVTSSCINFYNGLNPDVCGANTSTITVNAPLDSALFTNQEVGLIKDIQTVPMTQFLTFAGVGGAQPISFDLTSLVIPAGKPFCSASVVSDCTLPSSPFTFNQLSSNPASTIVGFTANLCAYVGGTSAGTNCSTGTPYTATFSTQLNLTIAAILAAAQSPGGVSASVSATVAPVTGVPEPGTMLLCGMGFLGLGFGMRRFRRA